MSSHEVMFLYSATLRIANAGSIHQEIVGETGIVPTLSHRKGDIRSPIAKFKKYWSGDMWQIESPLPPDSDLSLHLNWLWGIVAPHKSYFLSVIERGFGVDVFCGYRSNSDTAGFCITPEALAIFAELSIPMEISVMIHEME